MENYTTEIPGNESTVIPGNESTTFLDGLPPVVLPPKPGIGTVITYYVLNIVLLFLILMGNSLVIAAVRKFDELGRCINYIIVSLAAADLLTAFSLIIDMLQRTLPVLLRPTDLGRVFCVLNAVPRSIGLAASCLSVVLMAVDRFFAMTKKSARYEEIVTRRRVLCAILCCWLFSFASQGIMVYDLSNLGRAGVCGLVALVETNDAVYLGVYVILAMLASCVVHAVAGCVARKNARDSAECNAPTTNQNGTDRDHNATILAYKKEAMMYSTVGWVIGAYVLAWLPWVVMVVFSAVSGHVFATTLSSLVGLFVVINSMINPVFYYRQSDDFNLYIRKLLGLKPREVTPEDEELEFY